VERIDSITSLQLVMVDFSEYINYVESASDDLLSSRFKKNLEDE